MHIMSSVAVKVFQRERGEDGAQQIQKRECR